MIQWLSEGFDGTSEGVGMLIVFSGSGVWMRGGRLKNI
jgi:hypothetical protein